MKKLYLVDVSSMFFRAFYAIPPLTTASGLPTNALYGLLAMLVKLLRENKPEYIACCFDRKEPSFRAELYEDYKANRTEMPDALEPQMPYIRRLVEELGIFAIDKEGFEADDIIGTLAIEGAKHGLDVSIVSGDKDFAQLIDGRITLFDTMKNVRYNREAAIEKWGVPPEQMIDYLAIVGDTSDNIPGVHGVGPKGAQKLLAEFKTLEGIYENLDKISSESLREKLKTSKKSAFLAKKLVTIVTDVKLGVHPEDLKLKPINQDSIKALFDELEFGAFLRKLLGDDAGGPEEQAKSKAKFSDKSKGAKSAPAKKSASIAVSSDEYKPVKLPREQWTLAELKKRVQPYEEVWVSSNERGVCFAYDSKLIQVDAELEAIGEVLSSKYVGWKGFDLKSVWRRLKVPNPSTPKWDTMLAAYVLKAGNTEEFSTVFQRYTGGAVPDLAGPEELLECEMGLEGLMRAALEKAHGTPVLERFELPLIPVLYQMENRGVKIDGQELKRQSRGLEKDISELEKEIHSMAGGSFNIASPKQLGAILFEKLKLPMVKKTKTGYSTDSDVLSKLAAEYPICDKIISYRELSKLKSTYVDSLPNLMDSKTGRVHTHFHQALTQTGRLSSTDPNLQNIPIRTERGREIRKAFVADEGKVFLSVDYSQIELRVLAEITGDPGLCEAFQKDQDIHSATASLIFSTDIKAVTSDQRRMAKAVNFGIAYGQGPHGLAEQLGISRTEAKEIIDSYFNRFRKVKDYMFDVVNLAKEQGYVETLFGRRRYMDELNSPSQMVRKFGERAAINAPMQGTASDIVKLAMIQLAESSSAPMILQVHDEVLFECEEDGIEETAREIRETMEGVGNFKVPLKVQAAWGKNWDEAHA